MEMLINNVNELIADELEPSGMDNGIIAALAYAFIQGAALMGEAIEEDACSVADISFYWRAALRQATPVAFGQLGNTQLGSYEIEVM